MVFCVGAKLALAPSGFKEYREAQDAEKESDELRKEVESATQWYQQEVKRDEDALRRLEGKFQSLGAEYTKQRAEQKVSQDHLRQLESQMLDLERDLKENARVRALSEGLNTEDADGVARQWKKRITALLTVVKRVRSYLKSLPSQFSRASDKACEAAKHRVLGILSTTNVGSSSGPQAPKEAMSSEGPPATEALG